MKKATEDLAFKIIIILQFLVLFYSINVSMMSMIFKNSQFSCPGFLKVVHVDHIWSTVKIFKFQNSVKSYFTKKDRNYGPQSF